MDDNLEYELGTVSKWLRPVMYCAIVSIVNSVLTMLPFVPQTVTAWIGRGIMVVIIYSMFRLAPVNERYRKSGIMRAIMLICTLVTGFFSNISILTFASSILSILALYQEYSAHSEMVVDKDSKLSRNWHSLFNWSIVTGFLVGFASTVAVLIVAFVKLDAASMSAVIVGLLGIPQVILDAVYILYLRKMIDLFDNSNLE